MDMTETRGVGGPRRRSIADPTPMDVRVMHLAANRLLSPYYARFARSLGLVGGERVIDFGSGSGALARHIAPILVGGQGHLTCIDISPVWLAVARHELRRWDNVDYRLGDVATLGLEPETVDVVAIHFVLHDIPTDARQRTVDALGRALHPGGRVELREPLRTRHGIAVHGIDDRMLSAGLRPRTRRVHVYPLLGPVLTATYQKGHP
jgi:ubiquinone/menaquinone biosynthesis C-methylase UbiE